MSGRIYTYIGYALVGVMMLLGVSCAEDEAARGGATGNQVQIIGRVTNFNEHTVSSRGLKNNEESKINCMSLFIFDDAGECINFQHIEGSNPIFIIDRTNLKEASSSTIAASKLYILANVPEVEGENQVWVGKSLTNLLEYTCDANTIGIPQSGFPMIGHLDGVNLDPIVTLSQDVLEIPLEHLYAKIVFNVKVNTIQTPIEGVIPSFQLTSWEVHNVPKGLSMGGKTADGQTMYWNNVQSEAFHSSTVSGSNPVSGSNVLSFYFYMPEHEVNPATEYTNYNYPFDKTSADTIHRQRYKPCLVEGDSYEGKPTFVRMKGAFTDHQGHVKNVEYDIYLGLDNYGNFDVVRNYQYNNNVTIVGLTNYKDAETGTISVDHRVNVDLNDFSVAMERETLLDSHFEVRPIRINLNPTFPANGKVTVSVKDPTNHSWIRLEKKKEASDDHCANGKRKYFTTDLVTNTLASNTSCDVTSNADNCIWVYIDEYTDINEAKKDGLRTAEIEVTYTNGDVTTTDTYVFSQRSLYPVTVTRADGTTYTYYIEYYEEYLHNYDANDEYMTTDDEGMAWGLDGVQLSYEVQALSVNGTLWDGLVNWLINNGGYDPHYDFYITKEECTEPDTGESGVHYFPYNGYQFCQKIVYKSNIGIRQLDDTPQSAVEYCYNRNKRKTDGTIDSVSVHWYLPAIDEVEEIMMESYTEFDVFQEKYYWSSQPAYYVEDYTYSGLSKSSGSFYMDNLNRARATKVTYENGLYQTIESGVTGASIRHDFTLGWFGVSHSSVDTGVIPVLDEGNMPRTKKNRIRAVYKP